MAKSRSVLFIGNFLPGKSPPIALSLAQALAKGGWQTYTTSQYHFRPLRIANMLLDAYRLRKLYSVASVDVFSGAAFIWADLVTRLLRWLKKPIILVLHGGNLPSFAERHPQRIEHLFARASVIISPSQYLISHLEQYAAPHKTIQLIPTAVDTKMYEFRVRQAIAPKLVWLRAFDKLYNPTMALHVIAQLLEQFPKATLTMVGRVKDESFEECKTLAMQLGIESAVTIKQFIPKEKVPSQLNEGDIFINTTTVDNTPVSVIEAMACGLCVVSTNVGGIPFLLDDEVDALLVNSGDIEAMAQAISRLLQDQELSQRLSENGNNKVRSFDWHIVLSQWQHVLDETIRLHT